MWFLENQHQDKIHARVERGIFQARFIWKGGPRQSLAWPYWLGTTHASFVQQVYSDEMSATPCSLKQAQGYITVAAQG